MPFNYSSFTGNGFFGYSLDFLDLGVRAELYYKSYPHYAWWTTNAYSTDEKEYVMGFTRDYDSSIISPRLVLGGVMYLDDFRLDLSAYVDYYSENFDEYIAVDKNAGGLVESIVTIEEYFTTSEAWGALGGGVS